MSDSSATKLNVFRNSLPKTNLAFSQAQLNQAEEQLNSSEFPTTRNEAWKYTRLAKIANIQPSISNEQVNSLANNDLGIQVPNVYLVQLINGKLVDVTDSNLPEGIVLQPLSACNPEILADLGKNINSAEVFNSLNTLYAIDGVYIEIPKNVILDQPIHIQHIMSGESQVNHIRHYLNAGNSSQSEIILSFQSNSGNSCLNNVITEARIGENANLTINKLQFEGDENFAICSEQIEQEKYSTFTLNTITLGGKLIRNNVHTILNGSYSTCNLNGVYLLKSNQHVDNHTLIDHAVPNCESNELYKGVMNDNATGVFNGKVIVRKDAQKTNAFQSNANVLIGSNATINSKPELEIYADDVKCSHGSTTGQLDENAVFYLKSRGISENAAKQLIVQAFIADVLEKITNEDVLKVVMEELKNKFNWSVD